MAQKLIAKLQNLQNKSYSAYKSIKGIYDYGIFQLRIDHVQGDPFAAPSRISLITSEDHHQFEAHYWKNKDRQIAFEDFLTRQTKRACKQLGSKQRGSGKSGLIAICCNEQQVLPRNAMQCRNGHLEARLTVGLPANGRRIAANEAIEIFRDVLPAIVNKALLQINTPKDRLDEHVNSVEDQAFLRRQIKQLGYVAFIANGSNLPRRSGVDDRPLTENAIHFSSPPSMETQITLPNRGEIAGMAIPQGITLIVGGGFHGKSTLLNAIEKGIYNHIPGDGRELVVTDESAVKIRAEDGRAIHHVNISCFIQHLPFAKDTNQFCTENASGSTSQAANIVEAISEGADLLLIDEDTSATNFMIRDARMQALVADDKEPITPLIFRIREMYLQHNISSILVMGGSGDYFSVADQVIMLDEYRVSDVTQKAKDIAALQPELSVASQVSSFIQPDERCFDKKQLSGQRGKRDFKFDVRNCRQLNYGYHEIDLSAVEQLIDSGQTRSIAWIIKAYASQSGSKQGLIASIEAIMQQVEQLGLDYLTDIKLGDLALPRKHEVLAAINRIRTSH